MAFTHPGQMQKLLQRDFPVHMLPDIIHGLMHGFHCTDFRIRFPNPFQHQAAGFIKPFSPLVPPPEAAYLFKIPGKILP